jgi:hypothetical protein
MTALLKAAPHFHLRWLTMSEPWKGTLAIDIRDATPDWTPFVQPTAPENAPNVLFIIWDDVGYSAMNVFGGPIETPSFKDLDVFYCLDTMREEYESVGDLTFFLDDQVQTGGAFARYSIKRDEIHAGTLENPRATVNGLADIYGVIFLDPKEDQRLLPQLYQHLQTDKHIQLEGDFINRDTDAFIP